MTDLQHLSANELLERVENRNQRFKIASAVFAAVLVSGLIVLVVIGLNTLQRVNSQLVQQKQLLDSQQQILSRIQQSSAQRTEQINNLQDHINCVVALFQRKNREALRITDIENCKITRASTNSQAAVIWTPVLPGSNTTQSEKTQNEPAPRSNTAPTPPLTYQGWLHGIPVIGGLLKNIGL